MASKIRAISQSLWHRLAAADLRQLVAVAGLLMLLLPAHLFTLSAPDQALARLSGSLLPSPAAASGFAVIEVPRAEVNRWREDIYSADRLAALLGNVLHSSDARVAVILPGPLDHPSSSARQAMDQLSSDEASDAASLLQRQNLLQELLTNTRVTLGVSNPAWTPAGAEPLLTDPGPLAALPEWLSNSYLPAPPLRSLNQRRPFVTHLPVAPASFQRATLYRGETGQLYGLFLPHYLASFAEPDSSVKRWQRHARLQAGPHSLATSADGRMMPLRGLTERLTPHLDKLSVEEGLARAAFPRRVFIVTEGDTQALKAVMATVSVLEQAVAYTPWWSPLVEKALLSLILLYLLVLLPAVRATTGLLVSGFALAVLLSVPAVLLVARQWWLPFAPLLVFLVVGHLAVMLWREKRARWRAISDRADRVALDLAAVRLERGELDDAMDALLGCRPLEPALGQMYELSGRFSAKRQYDKALNALDWILRARRQFRDARQKREAIEKLRASGDNPLEKTTIIDATQVIQQEQLERPELGRYQLQEALGRGAMGQVYLGYDPRIARKVAIKTLSYAQFDPAQREDIKQRFFREAEAAGRLNHPNIVSVYDLGEEDDLAYIAMDYVEGRPLSAFVHEKQLLPVFEVYRIAYDVAQALEYAHGNQIVHRDIKPGNIMYSPSPYQVKVTDFGIARLTDNSQTSTGEILGSPLYMAPEQLKGKRVNYAADIFALGVTFYQLLSGQLPFNGDNLASLTYEIIHGKHKGIRTVRKDLPNSASRITNQALQKDPEDRYASAGDMAAAIKKAIKRDFAHEARQLGLI